MDPDIHHLLYILLQQPLDPRCQVLQHRLSSIESTRKEGMNVLLALPIGYPLHRQEHNREELDWEKCSLDLVHFELLRDKHTFLQIHFLDLSGI